MKVKKCIVKTVNYEKLKEVTQEWVGRGGRNLVPGWLRLPENLSVLTLPLLRDNPCLASISSVGKLLISGELQYGPQTLMAQLLYMDFGVFKNQDQAEEDKLTSMRSDRPRDRLKWYRVTVSAPCNLRVTQ